MDEETLEEALEVSESGEAGRLAALEKENAKLRKEAAKYRVESRNLKIESEFGAEFAEFVPKDLPIDEAREYAQRLKEKFASPQTEAQEQEAPEEAPEAISPLAAVSQPSTQGTPTDGRYSMAQLDDLLRTNPAEATRIISSGNWTPD